MNDDEKLLNLILYVTCDGEGSVVTPQPNITLDYGLLEIGSGLAIGIIQWAGVRMGGLFSQIYNKYSGWGSNPTPPEPFNSLISQKGGLYEGFTLGKNATWASDIVRNEPDLQLALAQKDLTDAILLIKSKGVTNYKSIALLCSLINLWGDGVLENDERANNDWQHCINNVYNDFSRDAVSGFDYTSRYDRAIEIINNYDYNNPQFNMLTTTQKGGEPAYRPDYNGKPTPEKEKPKENIKNALTGWRYGNKTNFYNQNGQKIIKSFNGIHVNGDVSAPYNNPDPTPVAPTPPPTPPNVPPTPQTGQPQVYAEAINEMNRLISENFIGFDDGYGTQCVALISNEYGLRSNLQATEKFDSIALGNQGAQNFITQPQNNWHKVPFNDKITGDIIVWSGNEYGHIGIVGSPADNNVYEQNYGGTGYNPLPYIRHHNAQYDGDGSGGRPGLDFGCVWRLNGY